ncbi:putative nucleolar and coiled-body phosphoprotein 1-like, partial [Homarus americanus]
KSATLPGRPKASGSSDEEDDDDELKLIKPKKVPRVPIAGPLMGVNISQVKLKKVETKMKEVSDDVASSSLHQEDDESKKELMLPSGGEFGVFKLKKIERSKEDKEEVGDADNSNEEEDKTKPAGELFGVKLKTIQSKDEVIKHDVAESKKEDVGATQKRHNKQPKIPLNNSALLNRSEISSPKTSPINQKKGTTERKKSPSPSIPLSKSVHALTKSVEEVSVTNDEAFCEPSKKDDTEETITKHVTIHHAKSIELKYSDNVENMESDPVMEVTFIEKEENMPEIQIEEYNDDEKLDIPSNQDQEGPDDFETIPQVSIVVKDDSDEEPEYEEFDEEFLRNMKQVAYASLPLEKQAKDDDNDEEDEEYDYEEYNEDFRKNITSIAYNPTLAPSQLHSPIVTKSTPSPIQSTSQASISPLPPIPRDPSSSSEDDEEHAYEEFDESFLQHVKSSYMKTAGEPATSGALKAPEDGVTPPRSPFRGRTSTNESTTSSKSDAENVEKKSGKFKFFRNKRSGSIGSADMKEVEVPKASKEKKKKGITIPKILSGKKGRDKHKKSSDETDAKPEMHKDSYQQSHEASKSIPEKKPETVEGETIQDAVEKKNSNEIIPENETDHPRGDENSDLQVDSSLSIGSEPTEEVPVVMRRDLPLLNTESRYSSTSWASNSSRDHDPAPSVPEKTRVRAKSPNHDIPQSNRPVTNFYQPSQPQEHETEDRKPVDGYISQEQIDAILSANETRDKKRLSQSRALVNLLTVPDGSKTAGRSDNAEEFISKRPSYVSINSMESDEPLPTTNFISGDRRSSSLGSLKDRSKSCESDSSGEFHQQVENASPEQGDTSAVPLGKNSRLTESFAAGNRISLTSPEFTVVEEDGPGTPDATNIFFPDDKEQEPPHSSEGNKPTTPMGDEEDEQKDYFPTVGRDVELRKLPANLTLLDSSRDNVRTSGIVGLKECLKQMGDEEEVMEVKTGISRLGHSAAVEKLKKSFEEL